MIAEPRAGWEGIVTKCVPGRKADKMLSRQQEIGDAFYDCNLNENLRRLRI